MEEIRIAVYFRATRDDFGLLQFRRVLLISFRAKLRVCTRWHDLACVLRGGIFHCLSPSRLRYASLSRSRHNPPSHLCHSCIVFTSQHAAYIILTSAARGNVRHFSVFLPNFYYVFFTRSSRNLPRESSVAMQFE